MCKRVLNHTMRWTSISVLIAVFHTKLVLPVPSTTTVFHNRISGISGTVFHALDALPIIQPSVSKYRRKLKIPLTPTTEKSTTVLIRSWSTLRLHSEGHGSLMSVRWWTSQSSSPSLTDYNLPRILPHKTSFRFRDWLSTVWRTSGGVHCKELTYLHISVPPK